MKDVSFYFKNGAIVVDNGISVCDCMLDLRKWEYEDLSKLKELLGGVLEEVNGCIICDGNKVLKSLGGCGLKRVNGWVGLKDCVLEDFGEVEKISGRIYCDDRMFKVILDNYNSFLKNVYFDLDKLKDKKGYFIYKGSLDLRSWGYEDLSKIKEWLGGDLVCVEGNVICSDNKSLKSLGGCGLRRVNGLLNIKNSGVVDGFEDFNFIGKIFS